MTHNSLTAFILDDEAMAIEKLRIQLNLIEGIDPVASSQDPISALDQIRKMSPDIIFLDIDMPNLTGFDVLSSLPKKTHVIFTTAYNEHAIKAFDKNVIDYLLKPFDIERLNKAIEKIKTLLKEEQPEKKALQIFKPHLISKQGDRIFIIRTEDIHYLKSTASGVFAYTFDRTYPVNYSLEQLEEILTPEHFIRLHRSYTINIHHIKEIQRWFGGKLMLIMNDENKTELNSSRDGAKKVKKFFHF